MMVTITAARRSNRTLVCTRRGPGAFKTEPVVLPLVFEKLEVWMQGRLATHDEIERFVNELNRCGSAALSFPERKATIRA